ncbi:hypothetical protein [Coleofasciculus sp. F4-SAH-05]
MTIEFLRHFYRATDPGKPLFAEAPEDQIEKSIKKWVWASYSL